MRKYIVLAFICCAILCLINCQEKKAAQEENITSSSTSDTITLPALKNLKPSLRLTEDAQSATDNWTLYQELSKTLDSLNNSTVGDAKKHVKQLEKLFLDLEEAEDASIDPMPIDLQTNAVRARLTALETHIKSLGNEISKNDVDPLKVAGSIARSKNALQDLNLQINERFALSIEEMLEAANEIPDSLILNNKQKSSLEDFN